MSFKVVFYSRRVYYKRKKYAPPSFYVMVSITTVQILGYHHTKDVCPLIAYCVTEFETAFRGLTFRR